MITLVLRVKVRRSERWKVRRFPLEVSEVTGASTIAGAETYGHSSRTIHRECLFADLAFDPGWKATF